MRVTKSDQALAARCLQHFIASEDTWPDEVVDLRICALLKMDGYQVKPEQIAVWRENHAPDGQDWYELRSVFCRANPKPVVETRFISRQEATGARMNDLAQMMLEGAAAAFMNAARYDGPPPEKGQPDTRRRITSTFDEQGREYPLGLEPIGVKDGISLAIGGGKMAYYGSEMGRLAQSDQGRDFYALVQSKVRQLRAFLNPDNDPALDERLDAVLAGDETVLTSKRLPKPKRPGLADEGEELES
jgi:hypothetical protein